MSQFTLDPDREHLGGALVGGDPATWFPELWTWLVRDYGVRSVVDVGCGEGHAMRYFRSLGCEVLGVDGIDAPDVLQWDFTEGPVLVQAHFDLAWCCEFVEHVKAEFIPNYLALLKQADLVLLTHASPGQLGHHHVTLESPEFWMGVMSGAGFVLNEPLTRLTRDLAAENENEYNHFVRSGMAFERE